MPTATITRPDTIKCEHCTTEILGKDALVNPSGQYWCACCISVKCFVCVSCGSEAFNSDLVTITRPYRQDDQYCSRCTALQGQRCRSCNVMIHKDDAIPTPDGLCCSPCYDLNYTTCDSCTRAIPNDEVETVDGWAYCPHCAALSVNFGCFRSFENYLTCDELRSKRAYGVELETSYCPEYVAELSDHVAWGAKNDCTISGKEFYSSILAGDKGLSFIRDWGKIAADKGWEADIDTGFHLHLNMRSESAEGLWAIAHAYKATEDVWLSFVEEARHTAEYSPMIAWTYADLEKAREEGDFDDFVCGMDREWLNVYAYRTHKTYEIRLHEGTCDGAAIVNWIKAHTRFADWAAGLGYEGVRKALDGLTIDEMFILICQEVWKDSDLTIYYGERARRHGHGFLTKSIGSDL